MPQNIATFGGGCFWGVEKLFREEFPAASTRVGYSGGIKENPKYEEVKSQTTHHVEVLRVEYPDNLAYAALVEFFFRIHDPTLVNRQGRSTGEQYRSVIFVHSEEQARVAQEVKDKVQKEHYPEQTLATKIEPAQKFWDAEEYHQQYLDKNPDGYVCHFRRW